MTARIPPKPVLMRRDEVLRIEMAVHHAQRSQKTIRKWCRDHGIGRQSGPNAPLEISHVALEMMLQGDHEALELLREGNRTHPSVKRFFDFLGLPAT